MAGSGSLSFLLIPLFLMGYHPFSGGTTSQLLWVPFTENTLQDFSVQDRVVTWMKVDDVEEGAGHRTVHTRMNHPTLTAPPHTPLSLPPEGQSTSNSWDFQDFETEIGMFLGPSLCRHLAIQTAKSETLHPPSFQFLKCWWHLFCAVVSLFPCVLIGLGIFTHFNRVSGKNTCSRHRVLTKPGLNFYFKYRRLENVWDPVRVFTWEAKADYTWERRNV